MEPSEKDLQHHAAMVFELAECFSPTQQEWKSIISKCLTMKYISVREKGDITSMEDLCECLMKKEKIYYGDYKRLREIIGNHGEAKRIIDKFTKLIRGEKDGCENYDPGSDEDEPSNTPKRPKAEEDDSHQFRKKTDNTHDARIIDVWARARQSVGLIKGPVSGGTGFRVGTFYIMTAYHVAADITKQHKSDKENWAYLGDKNVWIEFKFPEKYVGKKFHFEPELITGSKELDYAILELNQAHTDESDLEIPEPIRKFQKIHYEELFAMLGFPQANNGIMQFDSDIMLFDLAVNSDRRNLMIENGEAKPEYTGICDEEKVLFDCWVQWGASGSPGIVMGNDGKEPVCTLMLLRGYPNEISSGARVPREEMIEQGIKMETIADELSRNGESGQDLKKDIFGDCFS
ncbi:uncharacterized protein LOC117341487 isoform X2 [Pecten maximus]|uniref:uncharacterized protein LOC117341487 isoform X2 n=1 Tax=Pecten maximus TaxID=6579 RepID=UPI001457FE45|nr:uncharacterized protein LOC117341487 isoform X2 [Pecten maximus]